MTLIIVGAIIIVTLIVFLALLGFRGSKLTEEIEQLESKHQAVQLENGNLKSRVATLEADDKKKERWLDGMQEELDWHKAELEKRPKLDRKIYRILTLGMKATGKTSLTLKWSNPLIDLGKIEGTKIERYERSVSHVREKDKLIEHVFEVHDWGGEHIVDALQELIIEEIHGLLIVVDLGGQDALAVDMQRVRVQLDEFQPQALRYFFSPKTLASCKTVVLFINKSDLIPGMPAQVEERAKELYQPLIDSLLKYTMKIDVKVFVGSASYGHSTHLLFSHFVERILPPNAYDQQLHQRLTKELRPRLAAPAVAAAPQMLPAAFPFQPPPPPPAMQAAPPSTPTNATSPGLRASPAHPTNYRGTLQMQIPAPSLGDTAPLPRNPTPPRKG
jgi:GTPase SAR1 family protein